MILGLVMLLHWLGVTCLLCPKLPEAIAKPVPLAVSTITLPAAKPAPTPVQPPAPSATQPKPKKPQPKPRLRKTPQNVSPSAFSVQEQVFDQQPKPVEDPAQPSIKQSDVKDAESPVYTEPYLNAAYEHNPKPEYPGIARSRGWEGRVVLRVQVSEDGQVLAVVVEQSCGHESLDESAVNAVKQWRFVPAKRAEANVASSVLVPIIFTLQDQTSTL